MRVEADVRVAAGSLLSPPSRASFVTAASFESGASSSIPFWQTSDSVADESLWYVTSAAIYVSAYYYMLLYVSAYNYVSSHTGARRLFLWWTTLCGE